MKRAKLVQLSLVMCALILPLFGSLSSVKVAVVPTVITFDDGLVKDKDVVTAQYLQKFGVIFNGPTARDYSPFGPNFAHSGYMAIEQQCGEFCVSPIEMNFTNAQSRVKIWVGYSAPLDVNRTVILGALDNNGNPVGSATATFKKSSQPIPIQTLLEISLPTASIKAAYVGFSDNTNELWNNLAVDDVEFEGPGTQGTSTTTTTGTTGIADFLITTSTPSVTLTQGSSSEATITLTSLNGFSSPINLSAFWRYVQSVPTGITLTFVPPAVAPPSGGNATSTLTVSAATDASTGAFELEMTGTSGTIVHSIGIGVTVIASGVSTSTTATGSGGMADFSISSSASALSVTQGSNRTTTITILPLSGFNSPVDLSWSWVEATPVHVTIAFSLSTIGGINGGLLTFAASTSASTGNFTLRITGKSGSLSHSVDVSVAILPISISTFAVDTSPIGVSLCVNYAGKNLKYYDYATVTITVHSIGAFSSPVTFSADPIPAGFVLSFTPNVVVPAAGGDSPSALTVKVTLDQVPLGDYVFTIHATSGQLTEDLSIKVHVDTCRGPAAASITSGTTTATSPPSQPKCLIATATYGSELAPEVQLLRNFRDTKILKTKAGSAFMVAFNAWYYSFSPYVAGYLSTHWVERTVMKGVLYPLIGMLYLTSNLYATTATYPELAALLSGLLASSLIGAFYLGLPLSLIRAKVRRLRNAKAQTLASKLLSASLLVGIAGLMLGEILTSPVILMVSSATVILSTLFLSATITSAKVAKKLQTRI